MHEPRKGRDIAGEASAIPVGVGKDKAETLAEEPDILAVVVIWLIGEMATQLQLRRQAAD